MQNARKIAVVLGMLVVGVILVALQIAAFAGPLPAPVQDSNLLSL